MFWRGAFGDYPRSRRPRKRLLLRGRSFPRRRRRGAPSLRESAFVRRAWIWNESAWNETCSDSSRNGSGCCSASLRGTEGVVPPRRDRPRLPHRKTEIGPTRRPFVVRNHPLRHAARQRKAFPPDRPLGLHRTEAGQHPRPTAGRQLILVRSCGRQSSDRAGASAPSPRGTKGVLQVVP